MFRLVRHLVPWILFWLFTPCNLVLSFFSFNQFGIFYTLRAYSINHSIFNQSEHIQSIQAYSISMIFFTCSKHIELGAQGLAFEDGRRRHGGLSHLLLLSCSLDQGLRTHHLVTIEERGGRVPFWTQYWQSFGCSVFFHFDLFMGIFIIGCLLLMITFVSTWYASCTSWSFCIWPVRPGNSLSWANITLRALDF